MKRSTQLIAIVFGFALLLAPGCASSNNGNVLDPKSSGLDGNWEYLVLNAYEATFANCTGDATLLEGASFVEGLSMAPICQTAVTFPVSQEGDSFLAPAHQSTCSDGALASVTGSGLIVTPDLDGQWESSSDSGVYSVHIFSGAINGNTVELLETHREFSGTFVGSCDFDPELAVVITIQ